MVYRINRFDANDTCTRGVLKRLTPTVHTLTFTMEDPIRPIEQKVSGNTAIPDGIYKMQFQTAKTPMNKRYAEKFPEWHRGMIWLSHKYRFDYEYDENPWDDKWGFTNVYFHIGNGPKDTKGCILVGDRIYMDEDKVYPSQKAYERVYQLMAMDIEAQPEGWVQLEVVTTT